MPMSSCMYSRSDESDNWSALQYDVTSGSTFSALGLNHQRQHESDLSDIFSTSNSELRYSLKNINADKITSPCVSIPHTAPRGIMGATPNDTPVRHPLQKSGAANRGPSCRKQGKRASYKHIPHRDKPPHLVAKRNARERRRVQAVNAAFLRLRRHIPYNNRSKRLSKVKTLRIAIDYIAHLRRLLDKFDSWSPADKSHPAQTGLTNRYPCNIIQQQQQPRQQQQQPDSTGVKQNEKRGVKVIDINIDINVDSDDVFDGWL